MYCRQFYIFLACCLCGLVVSDPQQKFGSKDQLGDVEHLKHHLETKIDIEPELLSEEKRRFHYFNLHDTNKDGFIDGIELAKAIFHSHEDENIRSPAIPDTELERLVDPVLEEMDTDRNGFIDFAEYYRLANN